MSRYVHIDVKMIEILRFKYEINPVGKLLEPILSYKMLSWLENEINVWLFSYRKLTGIEFVLSEVLEPNLFVIRKQKRDGPDKVTHMLTYYVLDGSIYQAPQLSSVFAARIVSRCDFSSTTSATP